MIDIYFITPMIELVKANLSTVRRRPREGYDLSIEKWKSLLRSEHSTLRFLSLVVHDEECPYTVACQIVRTTKEHTQPEMSSGRPDWNDGKERDYIKPRWVHIKFTPIGLIRMMEQRMCKEAEENTRMWAATIASKMYLSNDPYIQALASFCHPICIKHHYCPHGKNCHGAVHHE